MNIRLRTRFAVTLLLPTVALMAVGLGCSRRPDQATLASDGVVLAFGDSLTSGMNVGTNETYPAILAQLTGRRVINAGVPGERTSEGLQRLPAWLTEHRPDLVILCEGGNDMLKKVPQDTMAANLRQMVKLATEAGAQVILVGPPKPGLVLNAPGVFGDIASEFGVVYEGKVVSEVLSTRSLRSEDFHPNADGNRRIAEVLATRIK